MPHPHTTRWVLLRHDLDDGSRHFDWLLERPGDDAHDLDRRSLLSFRLQGLLGSEPFDAARMGDHRRAYLDYQGPVSGGRGRVSRVDEGACLLEETAQRVTVQLVPDAQAVIYIGTPTGPPDERGEIPFRFESQWGGGASR
ncbi:MAG: hypothetical protein AAGD00_11490 [Planctomycetota bacterium]